MTDFTVKITGSIDSANNGSPVGHAQLFIDSPPTDDMLIYWSLTDSDGGPIQPVSTVAGQGIGVVRSDGVYLPGTYSIGVGDVNQTFVYVAQDVVFDGTQTVQVGLVNLDPEPGPEPDPEPGPEPDQPGVQISTGGYVRHRDRMVQESVFEDIQNTLITCRWMAGTTTRPVVSPYAPSAGWQIVTTTLDQVLKIVGKKADGTAAQVILIDYFPEAGGNDDENGESRKTEPNTFAVDTGVLGDVLDVELGSNMVEQQYVFTMAFYASSDAVALAVMNDLRDRCLGRIVSDDHLDLYNFNAEGFTGSTPPVCRMEIDSFKYQQNSETVAPWEVHLYFAEMQLTDIVDPSSV